MDKVTLIRGSIFISTLIIFSLLQLKIPNRPFPKDRWQYMVSNLGLVSFNNLILGLVPIIPFQMALIANEKGWGILNFFEKSSKSDVVKVGLILAGIIALDIVIYFQHRLFHRVNLLWKLHSMHHVDPMLDATSGLRFHPFEIIISNFIKIGAILILGVNPLAVIVFEIALNGLAIFNHSNIKLSINVEKVTQLFLITPALHLIHHSKIKRETDSNFGFSVPWWDRLFGTYIPEGRYTQDQIKIGTVPMPAKKYQLLPGMLVQPFVRNNPK